ncbi:MAG: M23 family metallopeptidase, partial [Microcystaceae cyanobacterium]
IEFDSSRLFLIDLAFNSHEAIPTRLLHRFNVQLASAPSPSLPSSLSYTGASLPLTSKILTISPPLEGKGWIAINGCCAPDVGHRSTGLPVNGEIHFAQRFALDWVQMDAQGRVVNGDVSKIKNYVGYGAKVLAVAEGTVVDILNSLPEQTPPNDPDPGTINLQNVLGNHVILDLENHVFALYAHLQTGSVTVKPGVRVGRGQVLGKLGNTGNTSAPHLHFHLMNGPTLGSEGLPYEMNFNFAGQIPVTTYNTSFPEVNWKEYLLPQPSARRDEFPLYLNIVDFPE